jgi:hypothetical protein
MTTGWIVQVCCRACGEPIEARIDALSPTAALPCQDPACGGSGPPLEDLADLARLMFDESRRRLAARACADSDAHAEAEDAEDAAAPGAAD